MKVQNRLGTALCSPLVHSAALLFLLEEWLWNVGARGMAQLAAWPPVKAIERRVQALAPSRALIVFALPFVLSLPVKLFGLFAIANGHLLWGTGIIVLAKLASTAALARIYALTGPSLLSVPWFAKWHARVGELQDRLMGRLHATAAWCRATDASVRALGRELAATLHPSRGFGGRASGRPVRVLRGLIALWRARRRR